jgi:hypothetical protein
MKILPDYMERLAGMSLDFRSNGAAKIDIHSLGSFSDQNGNWHSILSITVQPLHWTALSNLNRLNYFGLEVSLHWRNPRLFEGWLSE